jgi:hypothetical protein
MSNPIKYSTGTESLALKKGNFYIGTGDVGKGPTSTTGYYNGITPPSGGYTIYLNKESNGPSIYTASNDAQLISLTNSIAGQSYTGVQQCFDYFYGQTDKLLVNQDYPADYPYIVMDGLVFNLDAGITQSYPGSGTTWTDVNGLGPKNNGTLINGVGFNSSNGGSFVFDGTNDNAYTNSDINLLPLGDSSRTMSYWIYPTKNTPQTLIQIAGYGLDNGVGNLFAGSISSNGKSFLWANSNNYTSTHNITLNTWQQITWVKTAGNIVCYKNGVADNGGSYTINTVASRPYMGQVYLSNIYDKYEGNIGNFYIYNRALTATEVLQNFNAQKGRFGL